MVYNKLFDVSLAIKNTELYKYPSKGVIGEDEIITCQDIFSWSKIYKCEQLLK